jgi:5-methylcytosine-specific restriction endonuclease McrA
MAFKTSSKLLQARLFLKYFIKKYRPRCYYCGELFDEDTFESKGRHSYIPDCLIHHLDFDRTNNQIENLELVHRSCHLKIHRNLNIKNKLK